MNIYKHDMSSSRILGKVRSKSIDIYSKGLGIEAFGDPFFKGFKILVFTQAYWTLCTTIFTLSISNIKAGRCGFPSKLITGHTFSIIDFDLF